MIFVQHEIRRSAIHGEGLFTLEDIAKGRVVIVWPVVDGFLCEETEMLRLADGDALIKGSSVRLFANYFTYTGQTLRADEKLNHSEAPNLLYHCGILVARQAIRANEELTVDYRFLASEHEDEALGATSVSGFSARECFERSARELLDIMQDDPAWGRPSRRVG